MLSVRYYWVVSKSLEFWSSKAKWRLRSSLPSNILGLTFLKARKTSRDSKRRFSTSRSWIFSSMECLQLPLCLLPYKTHSALWTPQRFLTRKILSKNRDLFMRNENKSKCLQKFRVSSKQDKDCYRKTTPYLEQPSRHDSTSCDKGHNKPFWTVDRQTDRQTNRQPIFYSLES